MSMKNAAISVLGEICKPGTQKCLIRGQPVPCNQTDQGRGRNTSHLRESTLTVQNEELPSGAEVLLEGSLLGVKSHLETGYVIKLSVEYSR